MANAAPDISLLTFQFLDPLGRLIGDGQEVVLYPGTSGNRSLLYPYFPMPWKPNNFENMGQLKRSFCYMAGPGMSASCFLP